MIAVWALAGCAGGAETDEPEPTVLKSLEPAEGAEEPNNDDASPGEDEEEDPEPVPASSEGPAENWPEPEPPDEIYEPTEEGAEALIQYWFDARHYARSTGEVDVLDHVSTEDCEICETEIDVIRDVFDNGGWFVGEADEVLDSYVRLEGEDEATGLMGLRQPEFEAFYEGEAYGITEEADAGFWFALRYEEDLWKLADTSYLGEYDEDLDESDLTEEGEIQ